MSVTFYCNIRNDSVMFDTFDTWVQLNNPHPKKDDKKKNEAMKSTCVSRFDLVSNVKTSHGLKPSAQET